MPTKLLLIGAVLCAFSCQNKETLKFIRKINDGQLIFDSGAIQKISGAGDANATTYIIVRHGEKDTSANNQNPPLSAIGKKRAQLLAQILENYPIAKVYYTGGMSRTLETAQPVLDLLKCPSDTFYRKGIEPFFYNLLDAHKGKSVLIIGNTNTIPKMLNCFKEKAIYQDIDEKEYDHMYIVVARGKSDACIQQFKY
jgi:2,3-bisphosphoglycerate-dependent phosphoglycerate mutase